MPFKYLALKAEPQKEDSFIYELVSYVKIMQNLKKRKKKNKKKKEVGDFFLVLFTNRAPCFPQEKNVPSNISLPFLHERCFKQAQQPRLHGKPHHQPRWEAVTTPQQTAIYLLKSLWVQDFPEAPTSTGCQKSFDCSDSAALKFPDFHAYLNTR